MGENRYQLSASYLVHHCRGQQRIIALFAIELRTDGDSSCCAAECGTDWGRDDKTSRIYALEWDRCIIPGMRSTTI